MPASVQTRLITPDDAQEILTRCEYPAQRPYRQWWVTALAEEIKRGTFKQYTTIEISRLGQQDHLTDGQHRLRAVVAAGKPQTFVVVTQIVDNQTDVGRLYATTDIGIKRTVADRLNPLDLDTELGLSRTYLNSLGSAVKLIYQHFSTSAWATRRYFHIDDQVALMRLFGQAAYDLVSTVQRTRIAYKPIKRRSIFAVGILTFHFSAKVYGATKIADFWDIASSGENVTGADPRKKAYDWLISRQIEGGGTTAGKKVTIEEDARKIAACFNAWCKGQSRIVPAKPDEPIAIAGTPFVGSFDVDVMEWLK